MIGGDRIDAPDMDFFLQEPRHHVGMGTWMHEDIPLFIRGLPKLGEPMPSGVQNHDITLVHVDATLDHLGGIDIEIVQLIRQINDDARAVEPIHGDLIDSHPPGHKVTGRIEVGAHMVGRLNVLSVDAML